MEEKLIRCSFISFSGTFSFSPQGKVYTIVLASLPYKIVTMIFVSDSQSFGVNPYFYEAFKREMRLMKPSSLQGIVRPPIG